MISIAPHRSQSRSIPHPDEDTAYTAGSSTTPSTLPGVSWSEVYSLEFAFSSSMLGASGSSLRHNPLFLVDEEIPVSQDLVRDPGPTRSCRHEPDQPTRIPLASRDVNTGPRPDPGAKGHSRSELHPAKPVMAGQWNDIFAGTSVGESPVAGEERWEPRASQAHFPECSV